MTKRLKTRPFYIKLIDKKPPQVLITIGKFMFNKILTVLQIYVRIFFYFYFRK
jgi:hypothetical protein